MSRIRTLDRNMLLLTGALSAILYPITDIIAGNMYAGYSFNEQAVSELFAIGSPVSGLVVILFSISSLLLMFFSASLFFSSKGKRVMRLMSFLVLGNAINSLILWNFFPMHMRNMQPTFTDKMHTILAINPFILAGIIAGMFMYEGWFRYYSLLSILILFIPAFLSLSYIPLLLSHQPTPWMGVTERISQYGHLTWLAVFSVLTYKKTGIGHHSAHR